MNAVYQARFNRYLAARDIADTSRSRVWAFLGRRRDGRAGGARLARDRRPRGARQPHLRGELQPAAPRRPGARQRQDHPGARSGLPRRRLARHQGHLGARVGRAAGPRQGRRAAQQDERDAGRRLPAPVGGGRRLHPRALLRPGPTPARDRRAPLRRRADEAPSRRARLPEAVRRLRRGGGAHRLAGRDPGQDGEGLDPGPRHRGPQRDPPGEEADGRRAEDLPRSARAARSPTSSSRRLRTTTPEPMPRRSNTCSSGDASSGGPLPRRVVVADAARAGAGRRLRGALRRVGAPGEHDDGLQPAHAQPRAR